jgi:hypothetical protein
MLRTDMRRWLLVGALGAALAVGVAAALAASSALPGDSDLPRGLFGAKMARAEVVVVNAGVVHDYRVDQGRLRLNRLQELVILERDGTVQTVPVSPAARVTLNGAPSSVAALRRGMTVLTLREGDAPALVVRARTLFR